MGPHETLAAWRQAKGLSQGRLAETLGVARPTYFFWEKDRRPALEHAIALEAFSKGELRIEIWGYDAGPSLELARLRSLAARADKRRAARAAEGGAS
jgi:transcriptional regulator with XRE-family HTH domain